MGSFNSPLVLKTGPGRAGRILLASLCLLLGSLSIELATVPAQAKLLYLFAVLAASIGLAVFRGRFDNAEICLKPSGDDLIQCADGTGYCTAMGNRHWMGMNFTVMGLKYSRVTRRHLILAHRQAPNHYRRLQVILRHNKAIEAALN